MILHHYLASPFAEKTRLLFAYTGVKWQSSIVPPYPPRKTVDQLTGGYRRVPIAQDGADIYCDSNLIAEELALRSNKPQLLKANLSRADQQLMQNVERELLFASMLSAPWYKSAPALIRTQGVRYSLGVVKDRKALLRDAAIAVPKKANAKHLVTDYFQQCEDRLEARFFGGSEPSLLDFAVYGPLWARTQLLKMKVPAEFSKLTQWFSEMVTFAEDLPERIDRNAVYLSAKQDAAALPQSLPHEKLGKLVTIQPTDYAQDEVSGILVCATQTRIVLEVQSDVAGALNIHFPRFGYRLF